MLQRGERFVNTGDGELVRCYVEVANCVVNELGFVRLIGEGLKGDSQSRDLHREAF